jgi:hypothetical protein
MRPFAFPFKRGVPRAAVDHMPFPGHRTCAQWGQHCEPPIVKTDKDRREDAVRGSEQLRDAIRSAAG